MAQVCITERLTRTDAADPMAPRGFYLLVKTVRVRISHRTREASALLDKTLLNPKKRTTDQKGQKPRRQTKTLWKRNCACDDFNHAQFSLINHRDGWFIRDGSGWRNCPNWLKFRSQHFLHFVARNNACRICLLFFSRKNIQKQTTYVNPIQFHNAVLTHLRCCQTCNSDNDLLLRNYCFCHVLFTAAKLRWSNWNLNHPETKNMKKIVLQISLD